MSWKSSFYPGCSFPQSQGLLQLVHEFISEDQATSVNEGTRGPSRRLSSANHVVSLLRHSPPPHVALAVAPGVPSTAPKPGIFRRQGLLSGGELLPTRGPGLYPITSAEAAGSPGLRVREYVPSRSCSVRRIQQKNSVGSKRHGCWCCEGRVRSPVDSIFSRTFPNTAKRRQTESGSSIKKGAKNLFSFSVAISWCPPSLRELFLSALCPPSRVIYSSLELGSQVHTSVSQRETVAGRASCHVCG